MYNYVVNNNLCVLVSCRYYNNLCVLVAYVVIVVSVDVRPMNRRDEVPGAPPPLGTPARSLYDLVYHHKPPVSHGLGPAGLHEAMDISNMELYKDIILGKVPIEEGQSLALKQSRSVIRSNSSVTTSAQQSDQVVQQVTHPPRRPASHPSS